jgi:hypothetical protein
MSPVESSGQLSRLDVEQLCTEIERYLEVVETFRVEGCAPSYDDNEALVRVLDAMS